MIDLSPSPSASPCVHEVPFDPGRAWVRDTSVAIEAPPDDDVDPLPEARWSAHARRTGVCGTVSPRVVVLPQSAGGGYRLYYTQILPQPGFPTGANDYERATTRILSAISRDGVTWTPEPGVRLSPRQPGIEALRVASSEVVPAAETGRAREGGGRLRMYFESCPGTQSQENSIQSALSHDGGLTWLPEPGVRLAAPGANFMSPRIVFLDDGRCRLYCCENGRGIVSAVSHDGGMTFTFEPGVRVAQDGPFDKVAAFASEILRIKGAGYVMFYAGYAAANRAHVLRAVSDDGLKWHKDLEPVMSPGVGKWDAAKCSEPCVYPLPRGAGQTPRFGMVYESCDGTAANERGVWRIARATQA